MLMGAADVKTSRTEGPLSPGSWPSGGDGSVGIRFARPYDTDLMIGEPEVRAGNFNLGHMARNAVRRGSRTRRRPSGGRG